MNKQELSDFLKIQFPENKITTETQLTEMTVSPEDLQKTAVFLKNDPLLAFDFLISLTAVDFLEKMTVVYHLDSTSYRHLLVLKTDVTGRENLSVDTVSELWPTAIYQEREVYDLFGIRFNGHRDLRRLFMEDDYGYPLRKDFSDDIKIKKLNA
jgi:NADH:ubiquinone oxidoreductase subunit C